MNKRFWFSLISIAFGISIICLVIIVLLGNPSGNKSNMEKQFLKSKDVIINVAKYLEKQEYSSIYITSTDNEGEMFASNSSDEMGKLIQISDDSISKSIHELFEKYNFSVILKEQNGIYFQRWSDKNKGWGMVYSTNGERPINAMLTKLEPLKEMNWYFYEEK